MLRDHSAKGCRKTQDLWHPVTYVVLQAPVGAGVVFAIAPVDQQTKVKRVHPLLLKALVSSDPLDPIPTQAPPAVYAAPTSESESSFDGDLFFCPSAPQTSSQVLSAPAQGTSEPLAVPQADQAPPLLKPSPFTMGPFTVPVMPPYVHLLGQHRNPHHLLRPTGRF